MINIELLKGDITEIEIEAIVNAAITSLMGEVVQMEQFIEKEEKEFQKSVLK